MYLQRHGRACATWLAAAGVGLSAMGGSASAQYAPPTATQTAGTPQQLNPAGQLPAVRRARPGDVFSGPPRADCGEEIRRATTTFRLQAVDVVGPAGMPPNAIREAYADMVGQTIPVGEVCTIADRISAMLFARGILARVYLPEQQIAAAEGRVRIEVVEARIVSVRYSIAPQVGRAEHLVEAYLDHLRGLTPFDLDTAQRYLLLANDIPGVRVTAALRHSASPYAGEDSAGALDLDVTVTRRAINVQAAVENTNSSTLGPWSGIARADFNSFTQYGDRTTLIVYSTLGNSEQEVVQILEQARIGSSGLYAAGSFAYGWSAPGGVLAPLGLQGRSLVGTVELDYPAIRLRRRDLTFGAGIDIIRQATDFKTGGVLNDDNLRVLWARADEVENHEWPDTPLGDLKFTAGTTLEIRKGVDIFGASQPGQPTLSRIQGQPDAWVERIEGHDLLSLLPPAEVPPLSLEIHFMGQYTDQPLLAYEQQAIGNLTIGRGYDPSSLTADRAIAVEFQPEIGPIQITPRVSVTPYGFYDIAYTSDLESGFSPVTVRSVGGGVTFRLPYNLHADIAYADPLDKLFAGAPSKPPARVLVQIAIAF